MPAILISVPEWAPAAAIGPARIRSLYGDSLFRTPDSEEWMPATANTPLDEGDAVWCPDGSRVEIQLPDGTVVRLDGGSQIDLLAVEDGFAHLHLGRGRLYLRTSQTTSDNSLQIDADDTSVLPSARTRLRIDMLPDSMEDVAITRGAAYVEGNGSRTRVRAGEHILLEYGHNEILPLNPPDSWELWNTDLDREQSRSARAESHLPEELRGYWAELDANGTWVRVRNTAWSGDRPSSFPVTGPPIAAGAGSGKATTTSGSPRKAGAGRPTITADGCRQQHRLVLGAADPW